MDKSDERNGVRLDWVVNLGHILQAAVVVCGLIAWAIASAGRAEQAQRDLSGLKTDVGVQLRELRETLGKDLAEIHQELRVVSDQRVRMDATEKVLAQHDTRNTAQDDRIGALERSSSCAPSSTPSLKPAAPDFLESNPMLYRALIAVTLTLAGFAKPAPPPVASLPPPPADLRYCPAGVPRPPPPPAPRTVWQLATWAVAEDRARETTERARQECARRLDRLHRWIGEHTR